MKTLFASPALMLTLKFSFEAKDLIGVIPTEINVDKLAVLLALMSNVKTSANETSDNHKSIMKWPLF